MKLVWVSKIAIITISVYVSYHGTVHVADMPARHVRYIRSIIQMLLENKG